MRVAVVGGGVVGCALTLELARRGIETVLLEAEPALGLAASGTNSGILHTGFASEPGELETRMLHRSTALRDEVLHVLDVPVFRCGAVLRGAGTKLAGNARRSGVDVRLDDAGDLHVPGEWVTDPVAYTLALAGAAVAAGARIRTGFRLVRASGDRLFAENGADEWADLVCNCAGLYADDVARVFGDATFSIYPRKGEFLVFDVPLDRILMPVPTPRTRGVLVFPAVGGGCMAGPTAVDIDDKTDWSVRPEARSEVLAKAISMHPALAGVEPIGAYAGLRPAGRGVNYVVGRSTTTPNLVNVAAIRSTGLSASLGLAEHVADLVAPAAAKAPLARGPDVSDTVVPQVDRWWRRAAAWRA